MSMHSKSIRRGVAVAIGFALCLTSTTAALLWRKSEALKTALDRERGYWQVGTRLAPLDVTDASGQRVRVELLGSQDPTVLYFTQPGCAWCDRNVASVSALASSSGRRARLIGVVVGTTGTVPTGYLPFSSYSGVSQAQFERVLRGGLPQTVVVSPSAEVIRIWRGAFGPSVAPDIEQFFQVTLPRVDVPQEWR